MMVIRRGRANEGKSEHIGGYGKGWLLVLGTLCASAGRLTSWDEVALPVSEARGKIEIDGGKYKYASYNEYLFSLN